MEADRDPWQHAQRAAGSDLLGHFGRIGLAAQGVCFGLIGALAIGLAFGAGGKATDPQGALNALAHQTWSRLVLVLLCIGFGGYALWRFAQSIFDRGDMGHALGGLGRRGIQFVQGCTGLLLTIGAARTLAGASSRPGSERRAARGILGWPAGRELVGAIGVILLIIALVTAYWGLSRRFEESLATEQMDEHVRRFVSGAGVAGLCALGVVFGVVGWFLLKAALEFQARTSVGIGGALSKLANASYGDWLLGVTATGLIVFGVFDLLQARYHRV